MVRFIVRRLIGVAALVVIVSIITFCVFFLVPANPAVLTCGRTCTPASIASINAKLGLDKPLYEQYYLYAKGIVAGRDYGTGGELRHCDVPCFGFSFQTDQPVWDLLKDRLPVTLSIALGAAVLWLLIGLGAGILSALRKGSVFDRMAMTIALAGVSLPVFFTGLVLLLVICTKLQWLDYPRYSDLTETPVAWARNLLLPWFTLAFLYAALYARLTRANMLETMGEDYIRTARAKGLPERRVIGKHGLRSALTPIVTIFGLDLGALLGGALLTEYVYNFPGVGRLTLDAINNVDLPIILGTTVFAAFFIVFANVVVDVLYAVVDPKVRYS